MTREEAIEVLKDIYNYTRFDTYTTNEARTMAIKALEQEPCEDAISRDDVITIIAKKYMFKDKSDFDKCVHLIAKQVKSLPSVTSKQKIGRWIPVSERLPESDEDVLVTNGIGMYIGWIDATDKVWRVGYESGYSMNDILAWMPLPKPYKAESEEQK